jgi:NADPH:quinone reductase-like Zn-dependent oxidoreductase
LFLSFFSSIQINYLPYIHTKIVYLSYIHTKMATQNVLRLTALGSWENLAHFKEPVPSPGEHEVLIAVKSVSLNFRDILVATGKYPFPVKDQVVPGSDAAGNIVEIGDGVSGFERGDKVIVAFDPTTLYGPMKNWGNGLGGPVDGVLREHIAVPAHAVVKVPAESTLSYAQWASLVCTGATAWNSLYGNIPLKPGQTVLFQGEF